MSDIDRQLLKVSDLLEQLRDLVDERARLILTLNLTPSLDDNSELLAVLGKIKTALEYVSLDLLAAPGHKSSPQFSECCSAYATLLAGLAEDPYIDTSEYHFAKPIERKKSVHFHDTPNASEAMGNHLMGTTTYKPYYDDPESADTVGYRDEDAESFLETANPVAPSSRAYLDSERDSVVGQPDVQQQYAAHQQQMLEQDESLDHLSRLIHTQHHMGVRIGEEIDQHMILLDDLELAVDRLVQRVRRATQGVADFRRRVRENGSMVTIVVLTVILILLLVVLN